MKADCSISDCVRRSPIQERARIRVESLLDAAVEEFASAVYDPATMSGIARRAGTPIGSLYQYFPNKEAIARAVRTRHVDDVEAMCISLHQPVSRRDVPGFVDQFVGLMIRFVHQHPAFLALQDAPSSTQPIHARNRLRKRLTGLLTELLPGVAAKDSVRMTEFVLNINKMLLRQYAAGSAADRRWLGAEYRRLLEQYLGGHARAQTNGRRRSESRVPARSTRKASVRRGTRGASTAGGKR